MMRNRQASGVSLKPAGHEIVAVVEKHVDQFQDVAEFVEDRGEQVHLVKCVGVALCEFGVVQRGLVHEPTVAGGVGVDRDRVWRGLAQVDSG